MTAANASSVAGRVGASHVRPGTRVRVVRSRRRWANDSRCHGEPMLWPDRSGNGAITVVVRIEPTSMTRGSGVGNEIEIWTELGVLICSPGTLLITVPTSSVVAVGRQPT